jgi:hypothetical protein
LDNEKNSLVTTIKILQEGQKCEETGPLNAFKRQSANSPATKKQFKQSGIQTQNRYSILSETDNDGEDTLTSQKRFESGITPVAKDTVIVTKNSGTENSKDTDYRSSEIVLIGDSIIKHIDPKKLAKRKVSKYAYPGKSAEDIEAELRTIKVNSTPSHIIIHAGTNNIWRVITAKISI